MTKGLANFPEEKRMIVATRRVARTTKGNGYWGALSFLNSKGIRTKEQKLADALKETIFNANKQVEIKQRQWEKESETGKKFGAKKFKRANISTFTGKSKAILKSFRKQLR